MINFRELINADLHYGHLASRWNPAMEPYIWGIKNNVHLIDVSKTAHQLEKAAQFLESVAAQGRTILWICTKKAGRDIVKNKAIELNNPFVTHRWIGGSLTNFPQVKKSVTKLLHFEDILTKSEQYPYTKKELNTYQKIAKRLENNVGGIRHLQWPIGAIVIIDIQKENAALQEAAMSAIPIVALVDTNVNPSLVDYVIPGNDDSVKAIKLIVDYLGQAAARGYAQAEQTREAKELAQEIAGAENVEQLLLPDEETEEQAEARRARLKKMKGDEGEMGAKKTAPARRPPLKGTFVKSKKRK